MHLNILEVILLVILVCSIINGYKRGFLRILFSIVAWLVAIILVIAINPVITSGIEDYTKLDDKIYDHVEEYFIENGLDMFSDKKNVDDHEIVSNDDSNEIADDEAINVEKINVEKIDDDKLSDEGAEKKNKINLQYAEEMNDEFFRALGLDMPESALDFITKGAITNVDDVVDDVLVSFGVYQLIAKSVTHFIIQGIAFIITFIIVCTLIGVIDKSLGIVSFLPILGSLNRYFGVIGGMLQTLIGIWIFFYIISFSVMSELGQYILSMIRDSAVLDFLYENNAVLYLVTRFLR